MIWAWVAKVLSCCVPPGGREVGRQRPLPKLFPDGRPCLRGTRHWYQGGAERRRGAGGDPG
eukprot:2100014-Pyramimonas_sp.AAC.1